MSCMNCSCDECYLEYAEFYGPRAPPRCYECREVYDGVQSIWCAPCLEVVHRRHLESVRQHTPNNIPRNVKTIVRDEYQRMMREAQE